MAFNIKFEDEPYSVQIFRKGKYNGHDFTLVQNNDKLFVELNGYVEDDNKYCEIADRIKNAYKELVEGEKCK